MSIVRLTIPGEFWDSQIYRGSLYLFERSGSILTLDWDGLVDGFTSDPAMKLAAICAFKRSDYLYRVASTGIFHDPEFKALLFKRFSRLAALDVEVDEKKIKKATISRQDNTFPFPHADCFIYCKKLYVAGGSGLFSANCGGVTKHGISTRQEKLWDGPALSMSASYGTIALALGGDGLWEYQLPQRFLYPSEDEKKTPKILANRHCSDCNWAFFSIFGSSSRGHGFLASYGREKKNEDDTFSQRYFDRLVDDDELFAAEHSSDGYSWAAQDKICRVSNGSMSVLKYQPWLEEKVMPLGSLDLARRGSPVVAARVALFGTVIELPDRIKIILSDGETIEFLGEPTAWRVFPRSRHYENHLHVIYADRIEILSFNHDYFVDQKAKISGIEVRMGASDNIFDSLSL